MVRTQGLKRLRRTSQVLLGALACLLLSPLAMAEPHDCSSDQPRANKRFVVTDLNLRAFPGRYGDILATLPEGEIVYAYGQSGAWSRVNVASLNITGYVATRYLSDACVAGGGLTRQALSRSSVVGILIATSKSSYSGSCPCPYNVDRAGRRCGGRSAYSRPGGASPLCYPNDVSPAMIERFKAAR
ncbi:SH3 domain-containing protein [Henriciella aquimarina]|uniref:SH3 domain-containing protein n=1 Tax=Henriciella aquimarina TaxID=545261 RepID=UPI000A04F6EC|nr:SH3 domain-containing protein [Henriciella aquimarina]